MAILPYDCLETQPLERKPPGSYRFGLFALFLPSPTLSSFHAHIRQFGTTTTKTDQTALTYIGDPRDQGELVQNGDRGLNFCEDTIGTSNMVDKGMTELMVNRITHYIT